MTVQNADRNETRAGGQEFHLVDVFSEKKYAGNQLAVVKIPEGLPSRKMLQIAKEFHFSETSFITSGSAKDRVFGVRIFTPEHEVPFAGHPTLGTAYVIQRTIVRKRVEKIFLDLKGGRVPVLFAYSHEGGPLLWMRHREPTFGDTLAPEPVAQMLGLARSDIHYEFPIQEVSTGLGTLVVPVRSLDSVKRIRLDVAKYFQLIEGLDAKNVLVFTRETINNHNHLHVRVFAHYYGIAEDPATGSGNGCLAAYLVKNRYLGGNEVDARVEQGYEMGRPSMLLLKASASGDLINVDVGGRVHMIATGKLA